MTRRFRWLTRFSPKLPRLRRKAHSFAAESACFSEILMLAAEAQHVINLRLAAVAGGGPAAELETRLMVTEKMKAALDATRKRSINSVGDFLLSFAGASECKTADPEAPASSSR